MYYKSAEVKQRFNFGLAIVFIINLTILVSINIIIGVFLTVITMGVLLIKSGLEINTEQNKLRRYSMIFGYVIGKWENIPDLDYVTVVRVKMTAKKFQASSDLYVQASSSNVKFRVNLVTKDNKIRVIKVITCEMNEAINEALKIGKALDLDVLDYTSPERKWIKTGATTGISNGRQSVKYQGL